MSIVFCIFAPQFKIIAKIDLNLSHIDKRSYIVLVKLAHLLGCEKVEDKGPWG